MVRSMGDAQGEDHRKTDEAAEAESSSTPRNARVPGKRNTKCLGNRNRQRPPISVRSEATARGDRSATATLRPPATRPRR